jgi:hypothetical protein
MTENNRCKEHTGIEHEISNLKDTVKEQWKVISTMATATMVKWVVGIFILISMAVVGFLWKGQTDLSNKIEVKMETVNSAVQEIKINLNTLTTIMKQENKGEQKRDNP